MADNVTHVDTAKVDKSSSSSKSKGLGVIGLTAIVMSAMVGGGIFDLPKNMADNAGALGQIIAWVTTGIGMWFITSMFLILSEIKPDLTTGLYKYGEQGFGKFTGFFVSWGYWICECFANVAYAVLLMNTLDYFFPGYFTGGNNWLSIIGASIVLWFMSGIIMAGIRQASWVDIIGTVGMLISVAIFIFFVALNFKWVDFSTNFSAVHSLKSANDPAMGSVGSQVIHTMTVTLWVFGGVEGAVVLSNRAKDQKSVRHATALGFFLCLMLYALASLLPLGMASYGQISKMTSPASAQLLAEVIGSSAGRLIMSLGLMVAVFASWLTWTMMLAEMPFAAAKDGAFPKIFAKESKKNIPIFSLITATLIMQVIIIITHFSHNAFEAMYTIVATMTVPPYLISAMYLIKISWKQENYPTTKSNPRIKSLITGLLAAVYTIIMGLAAGISYLSIAFIVYAIGIPFYVLARHQHAPGHPVFTSGEKIFMWLIILIAVIGFGATIFPMI